MEPCRAFRESWLERALDAGARQALDRLEREGHPAACKPCAAWKERTRAQVETLSALPAARLPERLEAMVAHELARPTATIERRLRALSRASAPAELAARVAQSLELPEDDAVPESARSVRMLDVPHVPSVLDRLVEEELGAPQAHRAERFVGNLERLDVPAQLLRRTEQSLRRGALRRLLAPLTTLAAACFVVWLAVRGEPEAARSFRVTRAHDLAQLDPLARGLAGALGGGMSAWDPDGDDAPQDAFRDATGGRR